MSESVEEACIHIAQLQKQASKAGLRISFEKTQYMTKIETAPRWMTLEGERIKKVEKFKYLGEWVKDKLSDKQTLISRVKKMNSA